MMKNLLLIIDLKLVSIQLVQIRPCRFQWPHGPRRRLRFLACWDCGFESPPLVGDMGVCLSEYCVLLSRGLCEGLISRLEKSCRVCVSNRVYSRNLKAYEA